MNSHGDKYKAVISYDGTRYSGWQVQPNAITIQEIIEKALETVLRKKTRLIASGRTDAGVHAIGQVAHFYSSIPDITRSLNGLLPGDIRIKSLEKVPSDFHARFSAKKKIYHYNLHLDPVHDPITRPFSYHVRRPFNIDLAMQAAAHFLGTHDFTAFANCGSANNEPVKTVYRIDFLKIPGGLRIEYEGSGFLYKMVRNITGTLLTVASGKLDPDSIPNLLASKDRRNTPKAAAAKGLFLQQVIY